MNKIASRQIKSPITSNFSKATAEDLRRLTSTSIEDSYSRVQWTNPKDGKIYNLLKQGETEDGKILVRILDQDGAFVKETTIMPKEIAILDNNYGSAFELPEFLDMTGLKKKIFLQNWVNYPMQKRLKYSLKEVIHLQDIQYLKRDVIAVLLA